MLYGLRSETTAPPAACLVIGSQGDALGQFQRPRGIATFPDGSFVVVDRAGRVQTFNAEGQATRLWRMRETSNGNPKGLCALPDGNILVCDTHYSRVLVMTQSGEILKHWAGPDLGRGSSPVLSRLWRMPGAAWPTSSNTVLVTKAIGCRSSSWMARS